MLFSRNVCLYSLTCRGYVEPQRLLTLECLQIIDVKYIGVFIGALRYLQLAIVNLSSVNVHRFAYAQEQAQERYERRGCAYDLFGEGEAPNLSKGEVERSETRKKVLGDPLKGIINFIRQHRISLVFYFHFDGLGSSRVIHNNPRLLPAISWAYHWELVNLVDQLLGGPVSTTTFIGAV